MTRSVLPVVWLALLGASLVARSEAAWGSKKAWSLWRHREKGVPASPPGALLFHEGEEPLSWDNDELSRIRELHSRNFHDAQEYASHRNLAEYLGLSQVEGMHMPIPINIVLIGFQGDGNMGVNISAPMLGSWLTAVDAVLPHTRMALSELSCSEDGHCAGQMDGVLAPSPLVSTVHLNFSANVVVLQQGAVLGVFESALTAFSRPVDPEAESGHLQVDALKMEALVNSFVQSLGLGDSGYTLLLLNPHWSATSPAYGYRVGFSEQELTLLGQQVEQMQQLAAQLPSPEPRPPALVHGGGGWARYRANSQPSNRKLSVQNLSGQSSAWAVQMQEYLASEEEHRRQVLRLLGPRSRGALAVRRAVELLRRGGEDELGVLVAATLGMAPEHVHNTRFRASHPLEDCPTPSWVGHGRWLLLDLTAYRTDWGPALGGEGVVTQETLPDVNYAFQGAVSARAADRDARLEREPRQQGLKDELHVRHSQQVAALANRQQHAAQMHARRMVQGQGVAPEGGDQDARVKPNLGDDLQMMEQRHRVALLQTELDVYEDFALQHCHGRVHPPVVCADMKDKVTELKQQMALLAHHSALPASVQRHHGWDIFGADEDEEPGSAAAKEHQRGVELFLAELAAVLSRALRHVVAPPSATWAHDGYLHDTASPYAHQVHFAIYTIGDTSREKHNPAVGAAAASFDVNTFTAQLSRLALPTQTFTYTQHSYSLTDDPQLAAAFSVSLRTSFAEVPHAVADPVGNEVLYLDSRELAARLRQRFSSMPSRRAAHTDPHHSLEVPVFLFSLDRDMPVLIDEVYNARALEDMVLVVVNAAHQDEHPTGMMCDGVLLSRPLSPMKHALAAALQHLGGVLPPHLGYSPGRHMVSHDWLWSVGAHPLSWTSFGSSFSQIHIDALHRTYILDMLDASAEAVNRGIALLQHQDTASTPHRHVLAAAPQLRSVLREFAELVGLWRAAMTHAAQLDYGPAVEMTGEIEKASVAFEAGCRAAFDKLYKHSCVARSALPAKVLGIMLAGSALTMLVTVVIACLPRRKAKRI